VMEFSGVTGKEVRRSPILIPHGGGGSKIGGEEVLSGEGRS
jgi:hypothetical protein